MRYQVVTLLQAADCLVLDLLVALAVIFLLFLLTNWKGSHYGP